jgi:tight adherence protein B
MTARLPTPRYSLKPKPKNKISFEEQLQFIFNLKSQLAGGVNQADALKFAVSRAPEPLFANTRQAFATQAHVLPALYVDSVTNEFPLLVNCANLLEISSSSGSSIHDALTQISQSLINRRKQEQLISTELASTKATVFVLAGLPIMGAGMGLMLGTDSISWLLGTTAGRTCLVLGVILELAGWFWIKRLLNRALADAIC